MKLYDPIVETIEESRKYIISDSKVPHLFWYLSEEGTKFYLKKIKKGTAKLLSINVWE